MPLTADIQTLHTPLRSRRKAVALPERTRSSWYCEQRLRFIEARLFWHGTINRSDVTERFQVHKSVASEDFRDYQSLAPRNLSYDPSAKLYRVGSQFMPVFKAPSPVGLMAHTVLGDGFPSPSPLFEVIAPVERSADAAVMRNIIAAINNALGLKIFYRSMQTPEGRWRWIEPHCLVSDGTRWHTRAYCHERLAFRDFVVSRIDQGHEVRPAEMDRSGDLKWHEVVEVVLVPHRALSPPQVELVKQDYRMFDGSAIVACRRSLLWYALINLGLDEDKGPPRQVLELQDPSLRTTAGFR